MRSSVPLHDETKHLPNFETQILDEEIEIFARAHFFTNAWWIVLVMIFITIPPILKVISFGDSPFDLSISLDSQLILTLSWYLFVAAYAFQKFLLWYFNVYIVTNKRVVDIDFFNLFYKRISSTTISNIQDVRHIRGGVAQLLFNYGNVFVQTAGPTEHFDFIGVAKPNLVQKKIVKLIHDYRKGPRPVKDGTKI